MYVIYLFYIFLPGLQKMFVCQLDIFFLTTDSKFGAIDVFVSSILGLYFLSQFSQFLR
jgi:hypothetical protein